MTRLGIVGGGQLGRMLALAAAPLGVQCRVLEPAGDPSAAVAAQVVPLGYDDPAGLERLAGGLDVVTFEFENVPAESVAWLGAHVPVFPSAEALATAQDRAAEKALLARLDIPIPPMRLVSSEVELGEAVQDIGLPAVLKTRRLGYDGKGQAVLRSADDVGRAWAAIDGAPAIVEAFVAFDRELSILAVRGRDGAAAFYPITENHHRGGILRLSLAPAPGWTADLQHQAEALARKVLDALEYVGVLAIELFQVGDVLMANEMAPRVHNSGHWTQDGAVTSQFENHVRAVLGWPLGNTAARGACAMINLIGSVPPRQELLQVPGAHLHLYDKAPRPGRKLGHVNVCAADEAERQALVARIQALIHPTPTEEP